MTDKPLYSYASLDGMTLSSSFTFLGCMFLLGIACFFAANLPGISMGIILIIAPVFVLGKMQQRADFFTTFVTVHYFGFTKPVTIQYEEVKSVRPHKEPKAMERIFIAKTKQGKPIKKFTWHCTSQEFANITLFLKDRHIRILKED